MESSQATFRLDALPVEIQCRVFKCLADVDWNGLVAITQVNSHYYEIATKIIDRYRFDKLDDFAGWNLECFVNAMAENYGARAVSLKNLCLGPTWEEHIYDFLRTGEVEPLNLGNEFGAWALEHLTGLRKLRVAYAKGLTFLENPLPGKVKSLTVRPQGLAGWTWKPRGCAAVPMAGTLDIRFLPMVLHSQSLVSLNIGAQTIEDHTHLCSNMFPVDQSSIERMSIRVGNLEDRTLLSMFQAIIGLKQFAFIPLQPDEIIYREEETAYNRGPAAYIEKLPATSTFETALATQADTLERLILFRGDSYWHKKLDRIGSLSSFRALKTLDIQATMLLGWNHCPHIRWRCDRPTTHPAKLATLLPSSLENLSLRLEDHHFVRNGTTYVLDMVKSLHEATSAHLTKLRRVAIHLDTGLDYCEECDETTTTLDRRVAGRKRVSISIQEVEALLKIHKEAAFLLQLRVYGGFWDEKDDRQIVVPAEPSMSHKTEHEIIRYVGHDSGFEALDIPDFDPYW